MRRFALTFLVLLLLASLCSPVQAQRVVGENLLPLTAPVWADVQFPIASGKVGLANNPAWEALTASTSAYAFDVGEWIDLQADEVPHGWVEGTTAYVHAHITIKTAQATGANRYVKLQTTVAWQSGSSPWSEATIKGEHTIPTGTPALSWYLVDVGQVGMTGTLIGSQLKARVTRIAATGGDEYADSVFITQIGAHMKVDHLGSRSISTK